VTLTSSTASNGHSWIATYKVYKFLKWFLGDFDQFNCVQPTLLDCHVQSNEPTWRAPRMSQKKGHSDDLDNEEFTEALLAVRTHVDGVKDTLKTQIESVLKNQEKQEERFDSLDNHQNVVANAFNDMSTSYTSETQKTATLRNEIRQAASDIRSGITEQVQTANEKAAKSEHTSFVVRGMLGAQERKRRKIDVDEIRRLRIHVSILTRQAKDKDNLIGNTLQVKIIPYYQHEKHQLILHAQDLCSKYDKQESQIKDLDQSMMEIQAKLDKIMQIIQSTRSAD